MLLEVSTAVVSIWCDPLSHDMRFPCAVLPAALLLNTAEILSSEGDSSGTAGAKSRSVPPTLDTMAGLFGLTRLQTTVTFLVGLLGRLVLVPLDGSDGAWSRTQMAALNWGCLAVAPAPPAPYPSFLCSPR